MHRDVLAGLLLAGSALLIAACSPPTAAERQRWTGTTTVGSESHALAVDVVLARSGAWTGTYTVERSPAFTGDVEGTLTAGALRATLTASPECRFDLVGTVDGDALEATFAPAACAGATGGTWSATREPPASTGGATTPHDDAAFDGATFDAARFR